MPSTTEQSEAAIQPSIETENPRPEQRRSMSKALLNFWVDAALLVSVLAVGWISVIMHLVFPAPTSAGGWQLWGLGYNQWRDLQSFFMCLCALLALEHLVLHWNWVCSTLAAQVLRSKTRPDQGVQAVYGVSIFIGTLLVILASVIAALLTIKAPY